MRSRDVALQAYLDALRAVHVLSRDEESAVARQIALGHELMWIAVLRHPEARSRLTLLLGRIGDVRQARQMLHDIGERGDHSATPQIDRASRALRRAIGALGAGSPKKIRASAQALVSVRIEQAVLEELSRALDCDERSSTARLLQRGRRISQLGRRRLVESAARLVVSVAKQYLRPGVDLLDLIQDGNLALLRAVDKFDAKRGFRFATYALYWIRVAIFRSALEQGQTIRAPALINQDSSSVARSRRRLSQSLGRPPTDDEVAHDLGWTVRRVDLASSAIYRTLSLDLPIGEDGDGSIADLVAPTPRDGAAPTIRHRRRQPAHARGSWRNPRHHARGRAADRARRVGPDSAPRAQPPWRRRARSVRLPIRPLTAETARHPRSVLDS